YSTAFPYFFFFNDPATSEIYTLSLHDALPISVEIDTDQPGCAAHGIAQKDLVTPFHCIGREIGCVAQEGDKPAIGADRRRVGGGDRKSTRLNSSHVAISYAVFCLKKKKK